MGKPAIVLPDRRIVRPRAGVDFTWNSMKSHTAKVPCPRLVMPKTSSEVPPAVWTGEHSVLLDGLDELLNAGNKLDKDGSSSFSIELWIYPRTNSDVWLSKRAPTSLIGYAVTYFSGTVRFQVIGAGGSASDGLAEIGPSVSLNTWNHVVWVFNGKTAAQNFIYLNGVNSSTTIFQNNLTGSFSNAADFKIGMDAAGNYTNANYADSKVWNIALSAAQVSALYNSGSLIDARTLSFYNTTDCAAWWWMGDGPNDSDLFIEDMTGNGNNLTGVNLEPGDITTDVP